LLMATGESRRASREIERLFGPGTLAGETDANLLERFTTKRDELAFATLVSRHGAMVLRICRGVLFHVEDAEDAFQATFLVLARRATTLRVGESIGGWLHRVAVRAANQTRIQAVRRRKRERNAADGHSPHSPRTGPWHDVIPLLHTEIDRLPERFRAPIVLCELESMTRDEAARELGWPPGTVASRLARGRELLRGRLIRRGVLPAGVVMETLLRSQAATAAVPAACVESAASVALKSASLRDLAASGSVSAAALAAATGVLRTMIWMKIQKSIAIAAAVTVLVIVAVSAGAVTRQSKDAHQTFSGKVVDDQGKPLPEVSVYSSARDQGVTWGRITSEARTDTEGRFRLNVPSAGRNLRRLYPAAIWAYAPGRLVAIQPIARNLLFEDVPVRLVLDRPARTTIDVRGPDHKPIAGATVAPRVLIRGALAVPDGLSERIDDDTVTDGHGRAVMSAFWPEELSTIFVSAPGLGRQQFSFGTRDLGVGTKRVDLEPVGRVEGRVAGDPKSVRNVKLIVATSHRGNGPVANGLAFVTTDDQGRFAVPQIAAGSLRIQPIPSPTAETYVVPTVDKTVEPGKTTVVELTVARSVRIHGLVRELDTGRPVAGVEIALGIRDSSTIRTDATGRYSGFAPATQVMVGVESVPDGLCNMLHRLPTLGIPADATVFEVAPIDLRRAGTVRGTIVDEHDKPLAGARVDASWTVEAGSNRKVTQEVTVGTNAKGEFQVLGAPLGTEVNLDARHMEVRSPKPVATRVGVTEPVVLRLDSSQCTSMLGTIVDESGRPIRGACIHLRSLQRLPSGQVDGDRLVEFDGACVLTTDAEGRFQTPRMLDRQGEYAAYVSAEGYESSKSVFVAGSTARFPNISLRADRMTQLGAGRVVDRQGHPIEGVEVWISTEDGKQLRVSSNVAGRVLWNDHFSGRALLFARKDGYRFHGENVAASSGIHSVVLTRLDEDPERAMTTLAPPLPRAEALALARRVLEPEVSRMLKEGRESDQEEFLRLLASVDPTRALEVVAAGVLPTPTSANRVRGRVASAVMRESPDKAMAIIDAIADPAQKATAYREAAAALPGIDRDRKRKLLGQALASARLAADPGLRVHELGQIATRYLQLGDADEGAAILREAEPLAREMPITGTLGSQRGAFAEDLALIDPAAALKLLDGVGADNPRCNDRHQLTIVQDVAGRDPALAEGILKSLNPSKSLTSALPRIAHGMAAKDLDRARKLLARVADEPADLLAKPYALGMMALVMAPMDRDKATSLLREAFVELERLSGQKRAPRVKSPAAVACALLPVAEQIDPKLVPEFLWKAASLQIVVARSNGDDFRVRDDCDAALFLARYDRDVARFFFEPSTAHLTRLIAQGLELRGFVDAGAAIDPAGVAALIEALDDRRTANIPARSTKAQARRSLAAWLAADEQSRWDRATREILDLWTETRVSID
jgi:RNA polymerase sigma factor (sigma-70 family)